MLKTMLIKELAKRTRQTGFVAEFGRFVVAVDVLWKEDINGDLDASTTMWELYECNLDGKFKLKDLYYTKTPKAGVRSLWKATQRRLMELNELPWD